MNSWHGRDEQRGQLLLRSKWLAQWVGFSLIVMVNTPPSSGTARKSCASASLSHRRVSGARVHMQLNSIPPRSMREPRMASRPGASKNAAGCALGSFT